MNTKKLMAGVLMLLSVVGFSALALANNGAVMGGNEHGDKGEQMRMVHALGSPLEVHISDNGTVLVRGAKVIAASGNNITAEVVWGSASMDWTIATDGNTHFVRFFGGASNMSEVAVGDFVSFTGKMITTGASPFSVQATIVKDWSDQKMTPAKTTIEGRVKSVAAATVAPTTFVLSVGNKDYVVRIASDTSVLNSLWARMGLSSINMNDDVRVYGMVNSDNTVDATVVRDTNVK